MHEHDLDLIAALADGSASEAGDGVASDAAEARSLIETCPVCRAEYETQTEVIAWLAAAAKPVMTDLERAGLHRAVRSGLGSETSSAPAAPWWQRLGYVAAGLLLVAGLFGVLQNSGLTGGADTAASITTTTAAEGAEEAEAPAGGIPFVAGDAAEESAPTTTSAAMQTLDVDDAEARLFADLADEARAGPTEGVTMSEEDRECLARAGLDRHQVVREVEESGTTYLVVMPAEPSGDVIVFFVELPDCRVVFEDR
jgi:hypothetical protein